MTKCNTENFPLTTKKMCMQNSISTHIFSWKVPKRPRFLDAYTLNFWMLPQIQRTVHFWSRLQVIVFLYGLMQKLHQVRIPADSQMVYRISFYSTGHIVSDVIFHLYYHIRQRARLFHLFVPAHVLFSGVTYSHLLIFIFLERRSGHDEFPTQVVPVLYF